MLVVLPGEVLGEVRSSKFASSSLIKCALAALSLPDGTQFTWWDYSYFLFVNVRLSKCYYLRVRNRLFVH